MHSKESVGKNMDMFYKNLYSFLNDMSGDNDEKTIQYYYLRYTFGMFKDMVKQSILKLQAISVARGDKVILSAISTPQAVALLYACNMLGIVPVLADIRLSVSDYESLVERTSAKVLFLNDFCSQFLKLGKNNPQLSIYLLSPIDSFYPIVKFNYSLRYPAGIIGSRYPNIKYWRKCQQAEKMPPETAFSNTGNESVVFTTSGSTGEWKYVELKSYQLNMSAWQNIRNGKTDAFESVLSVMPMFTCYGFVVSLHLPLCFSKRIILHPIYKADKIAKIVVKRKPSFYAGVFSHFDVFSKTYVMKNADLSFMKLLYFGGDSCDSDKLRNVNEFLASHGAKTKLCQGYGMTEVSSGAFLQDNENYCAGSVGTPLYFTEYKIIKEGTFDEVTKGEEGEICLHTPCQTVGYFKNEEATESLIKVHPDGKKWIHTGDLGRVDENGNLFVSGRIKNLIVSVSGTKIFPDIIESCVLKKKGISEAAVVTLKEPGKEYEKIFVLYIVPETSAGSLALKRDIAKYCNDNLPMYLVPDKFVVCKSLPKTSSGKTNRRALIEDAEKQYFFRNSPIFKFRRKLK